MDENDNNEKMCWVLTLQFWILAHTFFLTLCMSLLGPLYVILGMWPYPQIDTPTPTPPHHWPSVILTGKAWKQNEN